MGRQGSVGLREAPVRQKEDQSLTCLELVKYNFAPRFKICSFTRSSSLVKLLAIFLKTSGAILGTRSQFSPISQRMLALATGTWCEKQIALTEMGNHTLLSFSTAKTSRRLDLGAAPTLTVSFSYPADAKVSSFKFM